MYTIDYRVYIYSTRHQQNEGRFSVIEKIKKDHTKENQTKCNKIIKIMCDLIPTNIVVFL